MIEPPYPGGFFNEHESHELKKRTQLYFEFAGIRIYLLKLVSSSISYYEKHQ